MKTDPIKLFTLVVTTDNGDEYTAVQYSPTAAEALKTFMDRASASKFLTLRNDKSKDVGVAVSTIQSFEVIS